MVSVDILDDRQHAFLEVHAGPAFLKDLEDYTYAASLLLQQEAVAEIPGEGTEVVYRTPKHPLNGAHAYVAALMEAGVQAQFVQPKPELAKASNTEMLAVYGHEEHIDIFHQLTSSEARTYDAYAKVLDHIYGGGSNVFMAKSLPKRIVPSLMAQAHMSALLLTAPKLAAGKEEKHIRQDLRVLQDYQALDEAGVRPLDPEQIHGLAWRVLEGMLKRHPDIRERLG